jgi:hypothetical protein
MKNMFRILFFGILVLIIAGTSVSYSKPPTKSKFYDFSEQIIDGEIKKPTTLYTDVRKRVKFERLLRLKKSFIPQLFSTAKEKVFK